MTIVLFFLAQSYIESLQIPGLCPVIAAITGMAFSFVVSAYGHDAIGLHSW